jgi:hypothetical protein
MKIRKQRGLTLIGFLVVLTIGLFFAYTGMKIIPSYLEYNALINALRTVQNTPGAASMSPGWIRDRIQRSLWVSYAADNIKNENIRISRSDGVKIQVAYEVRKSWIANIDLLLHFDKTVILRG